MLLVHIPFLLFQQSQLLKLHFIPIHIFVRQEDCFQRLRSSLISARSHLRLNCWIRRSSVAERRLNRFEFLRRG